MKKIENKWHPETENERRLLSQAESAIKRAEKKQIQEFSQIITQYIGNIAIKKEKKGEDWEAEKATLEMLENHFSKLNEDYNLARSIYRKLGIDNE